jgi:DNA invertase Pin-like site-specific DNA recombinase
MKSQATKPKESLNAVVYARYSSDSQREESIDGQIRECMEFAERNGIDVVGSYIDRALSAKTDNRPEFQRMIKDSYKRLYDMIIVWKLDRFARNRYDSAHYKMLLKKNGVKVVSAKETIAEGSEGILLESLLEGMAEYYSAELSEKVLRGLKENAFKCKVNGGQCAFGYKIIEQKIYKDETAAPIVEEIFTSYAEGKNIKPIVDMLNGRGIRTRFDRPMSINIIQYMLSNRKYIGEYKFRDIVVPNGAPAIVTDDLFERVQVRLKKNKKAPARHKAEDDYLLTTKLFCGKCGAYMIGESGTSRTKEVHRYYKCTNTKKRHTCNKKPVKKDWIERIAIKIAVKVLYDDNLVEKLTNRIYIMQTTGSSRVPRLQEQLKETETKIRNIIAAIEQGILTDSTKERLNELETRKKELEISILQEQIKKPFLTKEQIRYGIEKHRMLDLTTQEGCRRLIDTFINAIYLYDDKLKYVCNFKDGVQTVSLSELEEAFDKTNDIGYNENIGSDFNCLGAPCRQCHYNIVVWRFFYFNILLLVTN